MVLFKICVMIVLNPKQFPGSSVRYLPNSTQILNMMEISAFLRHGCFNFLPLSYLTLQNEFILSTSPMSLCRGEYPC